MINTLSVTDAKRLVDKYEGKITSHDQTHKKAILWAFVSEIVAAMTDSEPAIIDGVKDEIRPSTHAA